MWSNWIGDITNISFQFSRAKDKHLVLLCMNEQQGIFLFFFCDDQTQKALTQCILFFGRRGEFLFYFAEKVMIFARQDR